MLARQLRFSRPRSTRRPQLERDTPLIALAAARTVVEEAERWLGQPLPTRFASGLAHRAQRVYAHDPQFRRRLRAPGDRGRDWLYAFLRHWLAARLQREHPAWLQRLPSGFAVGHPLPA